MPKPEKVATVNKLKEIFSSNKITIFADFRGMAASEMNQLREKLKEQKAELKVVKNSLAKIALETLGKKEGIRFLTGPTAIIFSQDEISPAKVLAEYKESLSLKGGLINSQVLSAQQILALAALPPKEVLLAQLLGRIKAPVNLFAFSLSSLMVRLIVLLKEREKSLSGGEHGTG